jgi:hypothetical protein
MIRRVLLGANPALQAAAVGTAVWTGSVAATAATLLVAQIVSAALCYLHADSLGRSSGQGALVGLLVPFFGPWLVLRWQSVATSAQGERSSRAPREVPAAAAGQPPLRQPETPPANPPEASRSRGAPVSVHQTRGACWFGVLFPEVRVTGPETATAPADVLLAILGRNRLAGCELHVGRTFYSGYLCVAIRVPTRQQARRLKRIVSESRHPFLADRTERFVFHDELHIDEVDFYTEVPDDPGEPAPQSDRRPQDSGRHARPPDTSEDLFADYLDSRRKSRHLESEARARALEATRAHPSVEVAADGDPFVLRCLDSAYSEQPEARRWNSLAEHREVLDPLNAGQYAIAAARAEALVPRHPDFHLLYWWRSKALLELGQLSDARAVALQGLARARSKHDLCNLMGCIEWEGGYLGEAVYWWAQGMHGQESLGDYGQSIESYLHLHYVADGVGATDCAEAFLVRVDCIRAGLIRLDKASAQRLVGLAESNVRLADSVRTVVRELVARYVQPRGTSAAPPSEELTRTIRRLEMREELGLSNEEILGSITRLGEIGDPAAIPALTRALISSHSSAAAEAIERIRHGSRPT